MEIADCTTGYVKVKVPKTIESGIGKGLAFVTYSNIDRALYAIKVYACVLRVRVLPIHVLRVRLLHIHVLRVCVLFVSASCVSVFCVFVFCSNDPKV
jgi:hypothetical protein